MKFAALLRHSAEDLPELSELFRSYKQLKKRLKTLPQRCNNPAARLSLNEINQREAIFVRAILQNVQSFNDTFLDREENAVIQLRTLEDAQVAARPERVQVVYRGFVNLHGRLLLMVQWSLLAYTGICKILKKHHKRTGLLVTSPQLQNLLAQPFCSIELASQLVRKAEVACERLALQLRGAPAAAAPRAMRLPHGLSQQLHNVTQQAIARSQGSLVAASVSLRSATSSGSSLMTTSSSMSASLSASSSGSLSDSPSLAMSDSPSAAALSSRSMSRHTSRRAAPRVDRTAAVQRHRLNEVSSAHVVVSRRETMTQHERRQPPDNSRPSHRAHGQSHIGLSQPQDPSLAQPGVPGSTPARCGHWAGSAAAAEVSGGTTTHQQHSQLREGIAGPGALAAEAAAEAARAAAEAGHQAAGSRHHAHNHGVKRAHGVESPCPGSPSTHRPHKLHAPDKLPEAQDAWQRGAWEAAVTATDEWASPSSHPDLQQSSQQQPNAIADAITNSNASLSADHRCSASEMGGMSQGAEPLCNRAQPGLQQLQQTQERPAAHCHSQDPLGQQGASRSHGPAQHSQSQLGQQQAEVEPAAEQTEATPTAAIPTHHRHQSHHEGTHRHHPTHPRRPQHGTQQAGVQPAAEQAAPTPAAAAIPIPHRHHSHHGGPCRHHPTHPHRSQHVRHRGHPHQPSRGQPHQPSSVMRQTQVALGMWQQMQATAVTPSIVLPPVGTHPALAASISSGESGT